MALLLHGAIEPIDDVLHPSGCFKRRGRFKDDAQALTVGAKSLNMVRHLCRYARANPVTGPCIAIGHDLCRAFPNNALGPESLRASAEDALDGA